MNGRTDLAVFIGAALVAALTALLAYRIVLYGARKSQRGMSTRQRQRRQHWAIRIDDAIKSWGHARIRASEKRALRKRRRSR